MVDKSFPGWPFFEQRHYALRIYEGSSEVQKVVIARETLAG